jgi:hypothetical protein
VPDPDRLPLDAPLQVELNKDADGKPYYHIAELDLSGFGVRMAVAIGF